MKPAEQTPLTTCASANWLSKPASRGRASTSSPVGPETGEAIVRHPGIDKIAFTGSTAVGKEIMRGAAGTLKRVTLELGGKSPNIVFADADIDSAVKGAINGIFYGKGEVCNAGSRLFVESKAAGRSSRQAGRSRQEDASRAIRSIPRPGWVRSSARNRCRLCSATSTPGKTRAPS